MPRASRSDTLRYLNVMRAVVNDEPSRNINIGLWYHSGCNQGCAFALALIRQPRFADELGIHLVPQSSEHAPPEYLYLYKGSFHPNAGVDQCARRLGLTSKQFVYIVHEKIGLPEDCYTGRKARLRVLFRLDQLIKHYSGPRTAWHRVEAPETFPRRVVQPGGRALDFGSLQVVHLTWRVVS